MLTDACALLSSCWLQVWAPYIRSSKSIPPGRASVYTNRCGTRRGATCGSRFAPCITSLVGRQRAPGYAALPATLTASLRRATRYTLTTTGNLAWDRTMLMPAPGTRRFQFLREKYEGGSNNDAAYLASAGTKAR